MTVRGPGCPGPTASSWRKIVRQVFKDLVLFPAATGPAWRSTLTANLTANVVRNIWAYLVIFCGHFPDGAEKFTVRAVRGRVARSVVPAAVAR